MSVDSSSPDLAEALRSGDFHEALRAGVTNRGLSLARLRAHLEQRGVHVGQSTLSYWQRGLRHPKLPEALAVLRALESVLRLPTNSLVSLARDSPRPAVPTRLALPGFCELASSEVGRQADELAAELVLGTGSHAINDSLQTLMVHTVVTIDAQRRQDHSITTLAVRAVRGGVDRYVAVHTGDPGCKIEDVRVRAVNGCRVGRIRRRAGEVTLAVEFLFDRKLAENETHVFCFDIRDRTGGHTPGYYRIMRDSCGNHLLQLRFHPWALPARCTRQFRVRDGSTPVESEELVCAPGGVSSAYFTGTGPGLAGISVEWQ